MKVKAYKLAAELGLSEDVILLWLKKNGYPNAKRADMIREDVVRAAHKAFAAQAKQSIATIRAQAQALTPKASPQNQAQTRLSGFDPKSLRAAAKGLDPKETAPVLEPAAPASAPDVKTAPNAGEARPATSAQPAKEKETPAPALDLRAQEGDFKAQIGMLKAQAGDALLKSGDRALESRIPKAAMSASFAEMLEAHLPSNAGDMQPKNARKLSVTEELLQRRLQEAEAARDRYRAEADQGIAGMAELRRQIQQLQMEVQELRPYQAKAAALFDETAELQLDRTALKRRLQATSDELATLEQTCGELQEELRVTHEQLEHLENDSHSGQMLEELENATQREMAWRARALELERATHLGANLPALLQSLGLIDSRQQAQVLAALLQNRDTALPLLRAIRQVDHAVVEQLVTQRIRRTCAHPVCEQVTAQDDRVALRVDDDSECEVCHGSAERRWFTRMVQECGWAGVKRLLVIGGTPESHDKLRALSQGQPIEIRLVPADEPVQPARVEGRVEGCDLLILWSRQVVDEAVSESYAQFARASGRLVVPVLGVQSRVDNLARAVCNRLARNHVLNAD